MGSFSASRSQSDTRGDREILSARRSSGQSLRRRFLARWGEEIEKDWREIGLEYVDTRRGVSYPDNPDDALLFSLLCVITYKLYENEPWGPFDWTFPPIGEVIQLMQSCGEEIKRAEVAPPSYTMQALGMYNYLWDADDGF